MGTLTGNRGILVVGSVNYDYIVTQDRLPARGETLVVSDLKGAFGGKGANQAVQAARLGAPVQFIGAVGSDPLGRLSLDNLNSAGIECHMLPTKLGNGVGIVHVVGEGDVYATIFQGANGAPDAQWVSHNERLFDNVGAVIIQNEISPAANECTVELATKAGCPVIYNAAPARPVSKALTARCAWFAVNEVEAGAYLGRDLVDLDDSAAMRSDVKDLQSYCDGVILTLGRHGCYIAKSSDIRFVEAIPTKSVDATGAGDSFIGAFAVALVNGIDPFDAAVEAAHAASITIRGIGAQSSMPFREELSSEVVRTAPAYS